MKQFMSGLSKKLNEIFRKKWTLFIIISVIYLSISASTSVSRYMNLENMMSDDGADYYLHTRYTAVIASGVSPYSPREYFYRTSGFIPARYCDYAGYNFVNAIIMNLSTLSAEETVYVVSPFIFNLTLVLSIFFASKILKFSPVQATAFLVLHNFVNDPNAIFTPAYSMGETLGNSLGIVGTAYFLQEKSVDLKNWRSYITVPFLGLAVWLHLCNLSFLVILTLYVILCIILSKITKKEYSHNYKHFVFLGLAGLLVVPYIVPIFSTFETEWVIPYTDVGPNVVDPLVNPPPYPFAPTEPEEQNKILINYVPISIPDYPLVHEYQNWLRPSTLPEFLITFSYPFEWIYFGSSGRATLNKVMTFVGYNLTAEEVKGLTNFELSSLVPAISVLSFNIGIPLIFVATSAACLREKNNNKSTLFLSSYLLMIGLSLFFLISGSTIYANRFIRYSALFWVINLSGYITKNSKFIYSFFIGRSILWILALSIAGGL